MRKLTASLLFVSFATGCSPEPASTVSAFGVEHVYLTAVHVSDDPDEALSACDIYDGRVEVSIGTANEAGERATTALSSSEARRIKKLVRESYDHELAISDFQPPHPGTECVGMTYVQISDKKEGPTSSAGIFFESECVGFGGNWRAGPASSELLALVMQYCPAVFDR